MNNEAENKIKKISRVNKIYTVCNVMMVIPLALACIIGEGLFHYYPPRYISAKSSGLAIFAVQNNPKACVIIISVLLIISAIFLILRCFLRRKYKDIII